MDTCSTEVLIIGAGPAGLMAALALASMKVKVRVVDRRLPHETSGQADGIQPRMLEIWESLGLCSELRGRSEHVHRMVTYVPRADGSGIELKSQMPNICVPSARYQYEILARIDIIEEILTEHLRKEGVLVEYLVVPVDMSVQDDALDPYPVKMTVARLNERLLQELDLSQAQRADPNSVDGLVEKFECITAKFIIGCDGGKSWTRKHLNISMEGNQTDLDWGIIDFTPRTNFPTPRAKNIIQSPLYLPRPNGAARVYVMLGEGLEEKKVPSDDCLNIIAQTLRRGFSPYEMEITYPTWYTIFRASQRVASRFSGYGRVFLAGDACHTHSPKAGQGANASMSDTFNLAWKIGYVVQQRAKLSILDTYEVERRPHSLELLELDRKIFRLFSGQTVTPEQYTSLMHEQNLFTSGIGLRYSSFLVDDAGQFLAPGLAIGERLPSLDIIRSDDWRPQNLQDTCLFDGHFRLFILPGDILEPNRVSGLALFSRRYSETIGKRELLSEILETHIIVNNDTSVIIESLFLPLKLENGFFDRVYLGRKLGSPGLYNTFDVAAEGIVFLVRPDNYISAITTLDDAGLVCISRYFSAWIQG
ncbi:FAD binding domain-containing protein [Mycena galericulata]|nr:FAD binding domain-containing protein [Mycena galericulata]